MRILAIDTSCDDTATAIAEIRNNKTKILSNIVSSQIKLHAKYGGVYPTLAKREHQRNLPIVLTKALKQSKLLKIRNPKHEIQNKSMDARIKYPSIIRARSALIQNSKFKTLEKILEREEILRPELVKFLEKYEKPKIDAIAVTIGPGLEPCLWVGVNFARALALWWDLPIIPVNHLEAHLLANFINERKRKRSDLSYLEKNIIEVKGDQTFPAVGLVVSGGNTQLFLMKGIGKYKLLGETRDDAAGECFDKTARILGLGYPGGPAIAQFAKQGQLSIINNQLLSIKLPRPMINSKDYDFSFSGLKTAVLYDYKKRKKTIRESAGYKMAMACEIQQAAIDVLLKKTLQSAKEYQVKTIILGGGVAANSELRKQLQEKIKKEKLNLIFRVPTLKLCTDNAAMVAVAASCHFQNKKEWSKIKASANLTI